MVAPKLRFQEFDGDWESKKLKDLTDILKCGVASTPKYVTEGGYPFLSAQNISRNGEMNYSKVNNISDDFYKKISKTKLLKGDILYSRVGASYGVAAIFDREEEYGVYVSLTHIRVNDTLNNIFLKQFLNSPKARIQAEQGVFQGGGVQNLNVGVVEEFNLTLPSKQEQTKIASFLSAVDEKISQLTQKLELLSQYKQGMMQKLFSQQIRFKADDGSEFGEWEIKELGEILDYEQPTKYIVSSTEYKDCYKFPVLTAGKTFILGYTNEVNGIFEASKQAVIIFDDFTTAYKYVDFDFKVKSSAIKILVSKYANISYIHSALSTIDFPLGEEHKRRWISEYSKQEIPLPCLEEQTKIANFLSAIDQKIEVVAQQIEQAKQWKKGLLQNMFV